MLLIKSRIDNINANKDIVIVHTHTHICSFRTVHKLQAGIIFKEYDVKNFVCKIIEIDFVRFVGFK